VRFFDRVGYMIGLVAGYVTCIHVITMSNLMILDKELGSRSARICHNYPVYFRKGSSLSRRRYLIGGNEVYYLQGAFFNVLASSYSD
jgi:hypothetical protein